MVSKKKGTVEKERVVCQNCRYQYSYLYDAKEAVQNPSPTMEGTLKNYLNRRESFRPCPHCGYVQDWMVKNRRRHRLTDLALVLFLGVSLVLMYLAYQMIAVTLNPLGAGSFEPVHQAQMILFGYLGLVVAISASYSVYLRWFWNPNYEVDTESYEAATPHEVLPDDAIHAASQYEAATKLAREVVLPRKSFVNPWTAMSRTQKGVVILGILAGLCSLLVPALSPELALNLAQRGMTMLPFYLGVTFMLGAAVCGSWKYLDYKLH